MFVIVSIVVAVLTQRPADVVRWTAAAPAANVKAGGTVALKLTADVEPGWHLYAMTQPDGGPRRLEVKTPKGSPFAVVTDGIVAPLPKMDRDPNFDLDTHYYDEKMTIEVPVAVPGSAQPGLQQVPLEITYQACTGRLCLRPATETVRAAVNIRP